MVPMGFAMFCPAMSGAEPWMGSYIPRVPSPKEAEAIMPMEPVIMLASSERMSPKRFSVTMTSNWEGLRTSCMAVLSTSISVQVTSGYSAATSWTIFRQSREVSRTLALSTEMTRLSRFRAMSKAVRAMRRISWTE